jgi:hypothetical protein
MAELKFGGQVVKKGWGGGQARPEKVAYRQKRGGGCTKKEWSHEKDHDGRGHVRKMISR